MYKLKYYCYSYSFPNKQFVIQTNDFFISSFPNSFRISFAFTPCNKIVLFLIVFNKNSFAISSVDFDDTISCLLAIISIGQFLSSKLFIKEKNTYLFFSNFSLSLESITNIIPSVSFK